ncbi:hypothetical protein Ciccas_007086 [Cichlidogyrus casuarinus]|uniref:Uncharacterized protein n=1 Tax=Cichlidogyrus casuarinus TaxID=1844966 RepID=A0ABD2Q3W9_9PLAT
MQPQQMNGGLIYYSSQPTGGQQQSYPVNYSSGSHSGAVQLGSSPTQPGNLVYYQQSSSPVPQTKSYVIDTSSEIYFPSQPQRMMGNQQAGAGQTYRIVTGSKEGNSNVIYTNDASYASAGSPVQANQQEIRYQPQQTQVYNINSSPGSAQIAAYPMGSSNQPRQQGQNVVVIGGSAATSQQTVKAPPQPPHVGFAQPQQAMRASPQPPSHQTQPHVIYGNAPQQQVRNMAPPQQIGQSYSSPQATQPQGAVYGSQPQQGGYGGHPQPVGYGGQPNAAGPGSHPQAVSYGGQPQAVSYSGPGQPQSGGYGGQPQTGGPDGYPQGGSYAVQPQTGGHPQPRGYGGHPQGNVGMQPQAAGHGMQPQAGVKPNTGGYGGSPQQFGGGYPNENDAMGGGPGQPSPQYSSPQQPQMGNYAQPNKAQTQPMVYTIPGQGQALPPTPSNNNPPARQRNPEQNKPQKRRDLVSYSLWANTCGS